MLKIAIYYIFIPSALNVKHAGPVFLDHPDNGEYLTPSDNLVKYGTFSLSEGGEPYAGRLPGFIFPYLPLRILFEEEVARFLLGCFIISMSIWASIAIAQMLYERTGTIWAPVLAVVLLSVLPYYWHYDWTLHPNSLAASCTVLFIFYGHCYLKSSKSSYLVTAGFFLAWLFMLRGFTLVFIPVCSALLAYYLRSKKGSSIQTLLLSLLIFLSPLILFEGIWITRNYLALHQIVPLQTAFVPGADNNTPEYDFTSKTKNSMMKVRELIDCWGGDNFWYFRNSDMRWFISDPAVTPSAGSWFGSKIFSNRMSPSAIDSLRANVRYSFSSKLSPAQHDSIEKAITEKSEHYARQFKSDKFVYYYLFAPVKRLSNLFIKNTSQDWPGSDFKSSGMVQKALKLLSVFFYGLVLFLLIPALFVCVFKRHPDPLEGLLVSLIVSLIFVFAFVLNVAHYNYFIFGYVPAVFLILSVLPEMLGKKPAHSKSLY
jgi:hypothetical protein